MQADLSTNPKCMYLYCISMYLIFISVDKKKISVHSSVKANNKQGNWRDKIILFISTTYVIILVFINDLIISWIFILKVSIFVPFETNNVDKYIYHEILLI